jgi:hypothetical protein
MWFAATAPRGIEPMGAGGLRLHMGVSPLHAMESS